MGEDIGPSKTLSEPGNTPVSLARWLVLVAKQYGVNAITYHVSDLFDSFQHTSPHLYFFGDEKFSRHQLPTEHAEALGRSNEYVIKHGRPIILSEFLPAFHKMEPKLTDDIMSEARARGVMDQLMVPVFGPYTQNGVVTFAFPQKLDWSRDVFLSELEAAASTLHTRMIRHFGSHALNIHLSQREGEVLKWIARGKTNSEIAVILGIKKTSVGTYVKRIFEKMGVHDRVSAAVEGVRRKIVT